MSNEEPQAPPVAYEEPPPPAAPATNEAYEIMADKIGFVPNVRKSDNLFQLKFIGITILTCIALSLVIPTSYEDFPAIARVLVGLVVGLILGAILSGTVLAIKNLKR